MAKSKKVANKKSARLERLEPHAASRGNLRRDKESSQSINQDVGMIPPTEIGSTTKGERTMAEQTSHRKSQEQPSLIMVRMFSDMTDSWYDAARRAASFYVDMGEEVAKGAVEWQQQTTDSLKDASPLLERQTEITWEFVERSSEVARKMVHLQMERGEGVLHQARREGMSISGQ
jgi:hypothetical protein